MSLSTISVYDNSIVLLPVYNHLSGEENWTMFEIRVTDILDLRDLLGVISGSVKKPEDSEKKTDNAALKDWLAKDRLERLIIKTNLNDESLRRLRPRLGVSASCADMPGAVLRYNHNRDVTRVAANHDLKLSLRFASFLVYRETRCNVHADSGHHGTGFKATWYRKRLRRSSKRKLSSERYTGGKTISGHRAIHAMGLRDKRKRGSKQDIPDGDEYVTNMCSLGTHTCRGQPVIWIASLDLAQPFSSLVPIE